MFCPSVCVPGLSVERAKIFKEVKKIVPKVVVVNPEEYLYTWGLLFGRPCTLLWCGHGGCGTSWDLGDSIVCSGFTCSSDLIPVELDIYLPNLQLAFEYQGEQHYHDLERIFGKTYSLGRLLFRDHKKKECSNKFGINLITVPYWWDHEELSLREIITLQMKE
eukprot:TRINITY_DN389_c0_g1_i5.p2 TRINITY_DN389_c0_g1~~TRINITY_DN389_c0_g1_i5.p2  ORF type:complete len:163 (+),score=24.26 TRINITY_DN389_c0_g1_i5:766-1254(+)